MSHRNENLSKVGQLRRAMEVEERREEMRAERVMDLLCTIHGGVSALIEQQGAARNPFKEAAAELQEIAASLIQAVEAFERWQQEALKASQPSGQEMKEISQNQERLLKQLKAQTKILEEGSRKQFQELLQKVVLVCAGFSIYGAILGAIGTVLLLKI